MAYSRAFGGVHTGGEELHLLAHAHRGDAACDGGVVAPSGSGISLSDSYWMAEVSMEILAQKRL